MFEYKYLSKDHLKGLDNYKYSAIDSSPLSNYVMHPLWNASVKLIPRWIAPNLLTFAGFLCMVVNVIILSIYDYDYTALGGPGKSGSGIPSWVFTTCGILLFTAYMLDGIDGKQARKIGVSGPLGEMFDHGVDSYIVFFIPFCVFSVFGRDPEFSLPVFRGFLVIISIVLNFYVSHWEKYTTGTLFLPWGYDLSMWVSTILFLLPAQYGPNVYKTYVFGNVTFLQTLEVVIHVTGLFTTLTVAVYHVYLFYKNNKEKKSLLQIFRPVWPMIIMHALMMAWALKSRNDIIMYDSRVFILLYGTLFSNIASRLIVACMTGQPCDIVSWLNWPLLLGVWVSLYNPNLESVVLYTLTLFCIASHVHYGVCVVRQICDYFKISCFTVPKSKWKSV